MLGAKAVARAKINLFLKVGPRRDDGYHEIRSVMQSLELADELYFRRTDGSGGRVALRCNDPQVPLGEENIVWRAIEVFAEHTGSLDQGGLEVFINKRIPVGAGLAGGSADAAATLLALERITELDIDRSELLEMCVAVGSDVPFCLVGGTALVGGRGERLEGLEPLPAYKVVLASPGLQASTEEVYRRFDELDPSLLASAGEVDRLLEGLLEAIRTRDIKGIAGCLHNSLESATMAADRVEQYKAAAREAGASGTMMSGSGPAVFAVVEDLECAAEVAFELGRIAPVTIITSFASRGAEVSA